MDAIKNWANKKPCSIISLRRKLQLHGGNPSARKELLIRLSIIELCKMVKNF